MDFFLGVEFLNQSLNFVKIKNCWLFGDLIDVRRILQAFGPPIPESVTGLEPLGGSSEWCDNGFQSAAARLN